MGQNTSSNIELKVKRDCGDYQLITYALCEQMNSNSNSVYCTYDSLLTSTIK